MNAQDNKSYLTSIAIGFAIALPCIGVGLRFLARINYNIPLGWDDYTMVVGAVRSLPGAIAKSIANDSSSSRLEMP